VRLRHTLGNPFGHDPALPLAPYPGLVWSVDSPEARTALRRSLNRVAKALDDLVHIVLEAGL
jgi:hypothetical protein